MFGLLSVFKTSRWKVNNVSFYLPSFYLIDWESLSWCSSFVLTLQLFLLRGFHGFLFFLQVCTFVDDEWNVCRIARVFSHLMFYISSSFPLTSYDLHNNEGCKSQWQWLQEAGWWQCRVVLLPSAILATSHFNSFNLSLLIIIFDTKNVSLFELVAYIVGKRVAWCALIFSCFSSLPFCYYLTFRMYVLSALAVCITWWERRSSVVAMWYSHWCTHIFLSFERWRV
jgi:hypothetical protein